MTCLPSLFGISSKTCTISHTSSSRQEPVLLLLFLVVFHLYGFILYIGHIIHFSNFKTLSKYGIDLSKSSECTFENIIEIFNDRDNNFFQNGLTSLCDLVKTRNSKDMPHETIFEIILVEINNSLHRNDVLIKSTIFSLIEVLGQVMCKGFLSRRRLDVFIRNLLVRFQTDNISLKLKILCILNGFTRYSLIHSRSESLDLILQVALDTAPLYSLKSDIETNTVFIIYNIIENYNLNPQYVHQVADTLMMTALFSFSSLRVLSMRGLRKILSFDLFPNDYQGEIINLVILKCSDACHSVRFETIRMIHNLCTTLLLTSSNRRFGIITLLLLNRVNDKSLKVRIESVNVLCDLMSLRIIPKSLSEGVVGTLLAACSHHDLPDDVMSKIHASVASYLHIEKNIDVVKLRQRLGVPSYHKDNDILKASTMALVPKTSISYERGRLVISERGKSEGVLKSIAHMMGHENSSFRYNALCLLEEIMLKDVIIVSMVVGACLYEMLLEKADEMYDSAVLDIIASIGRISTSFHLPVDVERVIMDYVDVRDEYDESVEKCFRCMQRLWWMKLVPLGMGPITMDLANKKDSYHHEGVRIAARSLLKSLHR